VLRGVAVRDERDHRDVRFRDGAPAGDVVELYSHDGAIAERAFEEALGAPDSGGVWRVLGFAGDDDALEQDAGVPSPRDAVGVVTSCPAAA
jgi:hypothetical protein